MALEIKKYCDKKIGRKTGYNNFGHNTQLNIWYIIQSGQIRLSSPLCYEKVSIGLYHPSYKGIPKLIDLLFEFL